MKNRRRGVCHLNDESSNSDCPNNSNRYTTEPASDAATSVSKASLTTSISRFRSDFDDLKCKIRIFGESLNLCQCIANDFQKRMTFMEKRLQNLEERQKLAVRESNYSAIIQKNQRLSHKTKQEAKKLQMCGTEEEMREVAGRICRNYLHGAWKTVDPSDLDFKRISGGLSNFLYYVALPDASKMRYSRESSLDADDARLHKRQIMSSHSFSMDEPKKVLLRIYGQVHGERAMDAIVTESVIFTLLSERRLGPKLHGVFSGGRIEQYVPARSLLTKELSEPSLSMKIAEKMAAIHSMDVPLSKEPNWLWKTIYKWSKIVKEERLSNTVVGKNDQEQSIIKHLRTIDFDKEIEWLKKFLATVESPVVFCHNDMQEGNILMLEDETPNEEESYVNAYDDKKEIHYGLEESSNQEESTAFVSSYKDKKAFVSSFEAKKQIHYEDEDSIISQISDSGEPKLVLIDFEYCAYNYRGFDIANHFQEWCYDYTNPEPPFYHENHENAATLEQKEIFIKEYLKHYHSGEDRLPSIDDVNQLLAEVEAFALASDLFWSLWSIVNASKSQIPFGYWEYGLSRVESYLRMKQEVIKKANYGLPLKRKICEVDI
ncbi:unnamed protein product [Danaus chrysippus]|uniref:(African queen) hypothetical protein n=1 Tax=Danaus chrysippus TaxID=151541 RepID=A0A8J2RCY0_9NEOP|nr:unnamed protein product [Danaus chrysippus]